MPGYRTRIRTLDLGGHVLRIRSLVDTQQFADPDMLAERAGISPAQWSLFGHVWPSGRLLAEAMARHDVVGKRILEIGCGLGLASLVLRRRGADITASDRHPLAEVFLAYNAALNELPTVSYRTLHWDEPNDRIGRFDLIIGSDILYERGHAARLGALLERHAHPEAEVLIVDPGRGNSAALAKMLVAQGYAGLDHPGRPSRSAAPTDRSRTLHYRRPDPAGAGMTP